MGLTKAQLEALNISSFPDNTSELITPEILRNYNSASIANTVNQEAYNVDSASFKALINALDPSGSAVSVVALNAFTASQLIINSGYNTFTQSTNTRLTNIESTTASLNSSVTQLNANTASQQAQIDSLIAFTGSNTNTSLNSYTASNDTKWADLGSKSGSWITESETGSFVTSAITASSLITASITGQTLTFTKGDSSTFGLTIPTGSGGGTTDITALNAFTASQLTINAAIGASTSSLNTFSGSQITKNSTLATYTGSNDTKWSTLGGQTGSFVTETESGSFLTTASVSLNTITFTKGNNTTFAITVNTGSGTTTDLTSLNTFSASTLTRLTNIETTTASLNTSVTNLNTATASLFTSTSLSLTTASFSGNTLTFTKGNGTTFGVVIPDVSGSGVPTGTVSSSAQIVTLGFLQTSSFQTYTGSQDTKNIAIGASTSSLNSFTSSQATINTNLNLSSSKAITTASVSLNTITFTKGDATTFNITVNTGSATTTDITALNSFTASQLTINTGYNTFTSSTNISLSNLNTATASLFTSTSLSLTTASFSGNTLTFTKGNGTTFGVVIPDVSGSGVPTGTVSSSAQILGYNIFATTGSNTFNGNQTINGNVNITGSLTASGLFYPTTAGTAGQFMTTNGTNTLSFDDVHVLLEDVRYGESITIGDPLYVSGSNGTRPIVFKADAAIASKMPVIYVASSTAVANTNTTALTLGLITGVTTTGYPEGTTIYVAEGTAGWSASRPSGSASIVQSLGIVTKTGPAGSGRGLVLNPGPATLPNLQTGYAWVGNGNNQPVTVATSSFGSTINTGSFATTGSNAFFGTNTFSGAVSFTGSAPSILSQSFSGSLITNLTDTYTDVAAVQQIVTLTSASYAALASGSLTNPNTLYIVSGSTSGGGTTIPAGTISSSAQITGLGFVSSSVTASSLVTASVNLNTITFTKGDGTTFPITVNTGSGGVTTDTGSLMRTGSVSGNVLTFTKGDATTFSLTVATGSGGSTINTGSFATTGSNSFNGSQTITGSLNVRTITTLGLNATPSTANTGSGTSLYFLNQDINGGAQPNIYNITAGWVMSGTGITDGTVTSTSGDDNGYYVNITSGNVVNGNSYIGTGPYAQKLIVTGGVYTDNGFQSPGGLTVQNQDGTGNPYGGMGIVVDTATDPTNVFSTVFIAGATSEAGVQIGLSSYNGMYSGETVPTIYGGGYYNNPLPFNYWGDSDTTMTFYSSSIQNWKPTQFKAPVQITGSLNLSSTFTASLQQGYVWVGDSNNKTKLVATSSFGGGVSGNYATTGSNQFNGSQTITGSVTISGSIISVDRSGNDTNTIIGYNALGMGVAGAQPSAIGNTIAVAIGNGAMRFASGSNQNVAIGNNALLITSGSKNFAMGSEALSSNTLGSGNIAIGTSALTKNTTGVLNTAIGDSAGFNASGSQNIFIGQYAGYNVSGSNNTMIGSYQGPVGTTLNNNIILSDGSGAVKAQYSGGAWSLQGEIKLNKGSDTPCDVITVQNGTMTVSNSLVTSNSVILLTVQQLVNGSQFAAIVTDKTTGSFTIRTNQGNNINVAYLIINPTA
jgi:hypothetical protein